MKKVVIFQRRMVHYRVAFFEGLRDKMLDQGISLQVSYGQCTPEERKKNDAADLDFQGGVSNFYIKLLGRTLVYQAFSLKRVFEADLVVVPHEASFLTNYFVFLLRSLGGKKIAFWGHGKSFQSNGKDRVASYLKKYFLKKADWWFVYTDLSKNAVVDVGYDACNITVLDNAIDTVALKQYSASVGDKEKANIIRDLSLIGKNTCVFVGSMYTDKKLGFLMDAADRVKEKVPDFELLWVGDGPDRELIEAYSSQRSWSYFVGIKKGKDKARILSVSKLILNPGLVGLGILDSFSTATPLVTTDCKIHSPEIAYLDSGVNGLMTEYDIDDFANNVSHLLLDSHDYENLRNGCDRSAEKYTLSNMVNNFAEGVSHVVFPEGAK